MKIMKGRTELWRINVDWRFADYHFNFLQKNILWVIYRKYHYLSLSIYDLIPIIKGVISDTIHLLNIFFFWVQFKNIYIISD